jgi:hypothetical protein
MAQAIMTVHLAVNSFPNCQSCGYPAFTWAGGELTCDRCGERRADLYEENIFDTQTFGQRLEALADQLEGK